LEDLEKLQNYLYQFELFRGPSESEKIKLFEYNFLRFKNEYEIHKKANKIISLTEAPGYNIFRLLGVSYDEVKNSTFLANLLNPEENHGQELLFLQSFLIHCKNQFATFPILPDDFTQGHWRVTTETSIGTGRLDILITNWELGYLFVIENKIHANEQLRQLVTYHDWMDKIEIDNKSLIFLTITGKEAVTSEGKKVFCVSYRQDIAAWLGATIPHIKAPAVKELAIQYRDLVARF